jgi:hypothetical protein
MGWIGLLALCRDLAAVPDNSFGRCSGLAANPALAVTDDNIFSE